MEAELRDRLQTSLGGAYTLEQELSGGMARVFMAEETSLGRKVVVKLLPPELAAEVSVERFRREIQFAAKLQHPLIVPVLSATQQGALLYYTMPFVAGESLRARLRRDGALPLGDALRIWRDLVTALAFAHGHGVIHRDIKPENVLLTESARDGNAGYAMVTDFGVARGIDTAVTSHGLTATGITVGTPAYMAPEQVAADAKIDQRADIYAAGAVAYEMLTGQHLFTGLSPQGVLSAHVTREPEPISKIRPSVPPEVEVLVTRCLAKDPVERPASSDLRREIDALLVKETASTFETRHPTTRPRRWRRLGLVAAGVVTAGATIAPLLSRYRHARAIVATSPVTARLGPRSVAVVPFENSSPDRDNEYFADGVTDELISALARVPSLRVPSRSTSFAFKGSRLGARAIGDSLGVQMILTGSVRKAGNRLRIVTQLTRASDDSAIWSQPYDREAGDVFKVQEELAQAIVAELQKAMGGATAVPAQLVRHTTKDTAAYYRYLRGRSFWNRRTPEGFRRGAEYFDQAIERDSTYALAWAGKADSYCILANFGIQPAKTVCPLAEKAAQRAIQLDSTLAEAHASLGFVNLFYHWNLDAADKELKKAIALDSNYANAYLWLHHLAWARGDTTAMLRYMRRAVELEPLSLILNARMGGAYVRAGMLDSAVAQYRLVLEIDSTFDRGNIAMVSILQGHAAEGLAELERFGNPQQRAMAYAKVGRRPDALRLTHELETARRRGEWVSPLSIADIYAELGEADSAFAWLDRAFEARETDMIFLATEGEGKIPNDDPRLVALTRKMGFPPRERRK